MTLNNTRLLLKNATKDLLYPSESDAPFQVLECPTAFDPSDEVAIRNFLGYDGDAELQRQTIDSFFEELPLDDFKIMREVLTRTLTNLTVVRIGQVQVDVVLFGRDIDGRWWAIKSVSIET